MAKFDPVAYQKKIAALDNDDIGAEIVKKQIKINKEKKELAKIHKNTTDPKEMMRALELNNKIIRQQQKVAELLKIEQQNQTKVSKFIEKAKGLFK